jgi:hypothetical protein
MVMTGVKAWKWNQEMLSRAEDTIRCDHCLIASLQVYANG